MLRYDAAAHVKPFMAVHKDSPLLAPVTSIDLPEPGVDCEEARADAIAESRTMDAVDTGKNARDLIINAEWLNTFCCKR